jgi:chromosome segregation ATPase
MQYTITTAAKACGVGRVTIFRAIKSGKISATPDLNGTYHIEPAELHRVYPTIEQKQAQQREKKQQTIKQEIRNGTSETAVLLVKLEGLEALLQEKNEALKREQQHNEDLKRRLDQAEQERRDAQKLLTDQRPQVIAEPKTTPVEPVKKKRWWQ